MCVGSTEKQGFPFYIDLQTHLASDWLKNTPQQNLKYFHLSSISLPTYSTHSSTIFSTLEPLISVHFSVLFCFVFVLFLFRFCLVSLPLIQSLPLSPCEIWKGKETLCYGFPALPPIGSFAEQMARSHWFRRKSLPSREAKLEAVSIFVTGPIWIPSPHT